jgi:uncharacterized membrane protein YedE/YeeE
MTQIFVPEKMTQIFVPEKILSMTSEVQHDYFAPNEGDEHFILRHWMRRQPRQLRRRVSALLYDLVVVACCLSSWFSGRRCGGPAQIAKRSQFWSQAKLMANFTPISAAIGGALIGLSAVFLMMLNGRIAGVTGVFAGLIDPAGSDRAWRATFLAGLIAAPLSAALFALPLPLPQMPASLTVVAVAGLLVGFGTRLSNGCTSGHGVCGIARLSPRSIVATAIFMAAAIVVVAVTRHVFGA